MNNKIMIINRLGLPYLSFLCSICTWAQDNKVSHLMEIFHMAFGKEYIAYCANSKSDCLQAS